eukprot:scaffold23790_cov79-Isochrysis_galbana.AAC.1
MRRETQPRRVRDNHSPHRHPPTPTATGRGTASLRAAPAGLRSIRDTGMNGTACYSRRSSTHPRPRGARPATWRPGIQGCKLLPILQAPLVRLCPPCTHAQAPATRAERRTGRTALSTIAMASSLTQTRSPTAGSPVTTCPPCVAASHASASAFLAARRAIAEIGRRGRGGHLWP